MQKLLQLPRIIILMILFSFLSLAAIVFTPAYPELARQFHLSGSEAQWMMTLFLFGSAIGRLPYGPLANRFGRKNTLFLGLLISLLGTVLTLVVTTYPLVCLGRFIQALGCAATLKISYTMIADIHAGAAATKTLSYSMLVYAILPGIGTVVSGFLTPRYGWRGGFWFFAVFTLVLAFVCLYLPETAKEKDLGALKIQRILHGYARQFRNIYLFLWSCLMGLSTAVISIFAQEAPFLAIDTIGISPENYGLFYLVPAFGIAGGALCTAWLADHVSASWGMLIGISIIFLGGLVMGCFFRERWSSGWALFLPQAIVQFGDALLFTFASSQGLSETTDKSNASAVMLFINSLGSATGTFVVGTFSSRSSMTLPLSTLIISAMMFFLWLILWFHTKILLKKDKS
jgi:MFS family permease